MGDWMLQYLLWERVGRREPTPRYLRADPTTHSAGNHELYIHSGATCLYFTVTERLSPGLIVMRMTDLSNA